MPVTIQSNKCVLERIQSLEPTNIEASGSRSPFAWLQRHRFQGAVTGKFQVGTSLDPLASRRRTRDSYLNALLATALVRCWHILLFFGAWATLITVLNHHGHNLVIEPTVLTVIGTVLGFVISYRTTSSFERYNEGRSLWSQIMFATRTFARTVWFHIPERDGDLARAMIEKKTMINLLEAFSVAVKHYLRGEDGIYYEDLYYLVKFLPAYDLPSGLPLQRTDDVPSGATHRKGCSTISTETQTSRGGDSTAVHSRSPTHEFEQEPAQSTAVQFQIPPPVTTPGPRKTFTPPKTRSMGAEAKTKVHCDNIITSREDEKHLLPSELPPKYHYFDIFPFSLLVDLMVARGKEVGGQKAAKVRAKMRNKTVSHNLPLEISLYLSSYIAALQKRGIKEDPTTNTLLLSLNQLVESLTGLERILTTPIPFSYSIHLWVVTHIYCFALPPQIWVTLGWLTIPATVILTFIFFGFLVAGEEIENPFGYDKNDLNLDHFTHNIIRNELRAITSTPAPDPDGWVFDKENDLVFAREYNLTDERLTPQDWMNKGYQEMQRALTVKPASSG
ncbi:hypothetical protein AAF712_014970 [Marasmius tenuissimus]|uniref:Uncharacterized protein n=1 Tax=Marasmius tenuissimus TaxID=585030 RepID=A0ABR2ZBR6_9AGAR